MSKQQQQIPAMRFPEFGSSSNLKRQTLSAFTEWSSGGTPSKANAEFWKGDLPWISASSMHTAYLAQSDHHISEEGLNAGSRLAEEGDILILVRGSMLFKKVPVGIVMRPVAFNQDVKGIKTNQSLDSLFLLFWFQHFQSRLKSFVTVTGMGAGKLDLGILKSLKLLLPTLPEQRKIASFLSAVDRRIDLQRQYLEQLRRYKQGAMQQIFSQEIRFKDENGEDFPAWEEKKLGEVGKFSKGKGISKANLSESGQYECILYGELYTTYSETISNVVSRTSLHADGLAFSKENDVIIPASGETHLDIATASCIQKDGVALGGDLNIIRSKQDGVFLAYLLNNYHNLDIASVAQGSSVVHLYSSQLKQVSIKLPSLPEQQKIASFLSSLDVKIDRAQEKLEDLERFKRGLLQGMFV